MATYSSHIRNKMILNFIYLLALLNVVAASKEKSDNVKSKVTNQNLAPAAFTNIEAGLRSMDPHHFSTINASIPDLTLILTDVTLIGMKTCQITEIGLDLSKLIGAVRCNLTFDGKYDGKGFILSQPFEGSGHMHFDLNKIKLYGDVDITLVKDKKGEHWKLRNPRPFFELKSNKLTNIVFENLLQQNKPTGVSTSQFIKENPVEVFENFGGHVISAIAAAAVKTLNNLLQTVTF